MAATYPKYDGSFRQPADERAGHGAIWASQSQRGIPLLLAFTRLAPTWAARCLPGAPDRRGITPGKATLPNLNAPSQGLHARV